jgi:Putative Ig domain
MFLRWLQSVVLVVLAAELCRADPEISTPARLPDAVVGSAYSQSLAATDGSPPYSWAITAGALPPGLNLSPQGAITGTPRTAGDYSFTARVTDRAGDRASRNFTLGVVPALAIVTTSPLGDGAVGARYAQTLTASGGTAPYTWSLASGSLPPGVALDASTGILSGTPTSPGTFSATLRVTDAARAAASRAFTVVIAPQPLPALSITGLAATLEPATQPRIEIAIPSPYPTPVTGQITLTFEPDAAVPRDDPAIQFSTGGRTVSYTIPAGATRATFAAPQLALQTGTVAGRITLNATGQATGASATTTGRQIAVIPRGVPVVRSVRMVRVGAGFEVRVVGYSPSRELTQAAFRFSSAGASVLQPGQVTTNLGEPAATWFQSTASTAFGGQFTLVQPFSVQGDSGALTSVAVTLTNSMGTSQTVSGGF